jgi:hypothetical protein
MQSQAKEQNQIVGKYKIREILSDNWEEFLETMEKEGKSVRKDIIREVEKVIHCQDISRGFALYACPECDRLKQVPFTCKSRFCNCCGAKYSKDRSLNISAKLLKANHRHIVFTIPQELRKYFAHDRALLNLLFEAATDAVFFDLAVIKTRGRTISPA